MLVRPLEAEDGRHVEAFLSTFPPAVVPPAFRERTVRDRGRVLVNRTQPPWHLALVATLAEGAGAGRIVAAAQYDRDSAGPATASFSVLVAPELQGRGLATTLVRALAAAALNRFLRPDRIAVVGASRTPEPRSSPTRVMVCRHLPKLWTNDPSRTVR